MKYGIVKRLQKNSIFNFARMVHTAAEREILKRKKSHSDGMH